MWILPANMHKQYFHSLPECEDLKEELSDLEQGSTLPLMWRSKPSPLRTWLQRWNRESYMKLLFGRILKLSLHTTFVEKYTASLPDIHVNHSVMQANEKEPMIQDTFGRIYTRLLSQLNLFGASWKMYQDTSAWDLMKFTKAYQIWVTELRQDYSQRLKLARHTFDKDYLSLHGPTMDNCGTVWPTPVANAGSYQVSPGSKIIRLQLPKAVEHWSTLMLPRSRESLSEMNRKSPSLEAQVKMYPTPVASESQKVVKNTNQNSLTKMAINGQLHHPSLKQNGNTPGRLNQAWVAQLMGTDIESIYFVCSATE